MGIERFVQRGLFLIGFLAAPVIVTAAENYIQLTRPTTFRQPAQESTLEGSVDLGAIRRIKVVVEPFLLNKNAEPRVYEWPVHNQTFQGTVQFFPGINLVSLGTPGGPATARYAFVVAADNEGNRENWGEAGTVAWTEPQTLRHVKPQLRVAGLVGRPNTQTVDVLALTTEDISALDPHSDFAGARLTFDRVELKGGRFETMVQLLPGANILLARPGPHASTRADTGLRTVFFEPQSSRISLEEPLLAQGRLFLRGSSKGHPVKIEVSAWVRGPSNTPIRKEKIWETTLSTDTSGIFETNVALKDIPLAPQVQGFPEVSAITGKDRAIRVVVGWKNQK